MWNDDSTTASVVTSRPTGPTSLRKFDSWSNCRISFCCCSFETASISTPGVWTRGALPGTGASVRSAGRRAHERQRAIAPRGELQRAIAGDEHGRLVRVNAHRDRVEAALHRHHERIADAHEPAALVALRRQ